jgi:hypothetical protein
MLGERVEKTERNSLSAPALEVHAENVLRRLRAAFVDLLAALHIDAESPRRVALRLGLDKSLAWKVARIAHGVDLFAIGQHLPGSAGTEIFFNAVKQRGAPPPLIEAARSAVRDFNRLVEIHSGDRASLEMMLSSYARESSERLEMLHRKQLFSGASYLWGVQAKTQLRADFVAPSDEPEMVDIVSLRGFIGLRRLRPEVPWVIDRTRIADDDAKVRQPSRREALDPRCDTESDAPLLPEFCSKPLPEVRRVPGPEGFVHFELAGGPVGDTGAVTCISGEVFRRAAPRYRTEQNTLGEHAQLMRTPCKLLVLDVFLHQDLDFATPPELVVEGQILGLTYPPADRDHARLPVHETVQDLGAGPPLVQTPDIPNYGRIVQAVFDRVGWNPADFHGFRVRMRYPPSPTVVVLYYPLPEQASSD